MNNWNFMNLPSEEEHEKKVVKFKRKQKEFVSKRGFSDILKRKNLAKLASKELKIGKEIIFLHDEDCYDPKYDEFLVKYNQNRGGYDVTENVSREEHLKSLSCIVDDTYFLVHFDYKVNRYLENFVIGKNRPWQRIFIKEKNERGYYIYLFNPHNKHVPKEILEDYKDTYFRKLGRKEKLQKLEPFVKEPSQYLKTN